MHSHLPLCVAVDHRCYRGAASARAGRFGLAHSALPKPGLDLTRRDNARKFDIRAIREGWMRFQLRSKRAPIELLKILYEDRAVRVSNRSRSYRHSLIS